MNGESGWIDGKFITFVLGREEYGISLHKVRELLGPEGIQDADQKGPCVRGVLKLRQQTVPVIDLRCHFGFGMNTGKEASAVLVTSFGADSTMVGLMVDSIRQVLHIKSSFLKKPLSLERDPKTTLVMGLVEIEGRHISLLDLDNGLDLLSFFDEVLK